ncbi:MAG TPA: EutN/CcmL family microcompartment protein [Actinobacteria bacterium]|jgi:microcompartment protein CcmK/EutM|nr:EutN/CcmL family microcompartment protein [Actinomycetota bacterium]
MLIAEIIGTVTSTVKVKKIEGTKLKIARTIDPDGKPTGRYFIVEDGVGVGSGEIVLLSDDDIAISRIVGIDKTPIKSAVVAKVDKINIYDLKD